MNGTLDGVPVIVDHEDCCPHTETGQRTKFSDGELSGSITDQDNWTTIRRRKCRAEQCRKRVADGGPQRLSNEDHVVRESVRTHPIERGALIGKYQVAKTQGVRDDIPKRVLVKWLTTGSLFVSRASRYGRRSARTETRPAPSNMDSAATRNPASASGFVTLGDIGSGPLGGETSP